MTGQLGNDLLCQLLEQQTANAQTLGALQADMKTMLRSQDETKTGLLDTRNRVQKLEDGNTKQIGFLAGVQFVLTGLGVTVAKKLGCL